MPAEKQKKHIALRTITKIAILSAIATLLMLFEFPLWFVPGFYKLDLSEAVILMGGFAMGPTAAVAIELIKNLLHLLFTGTTTAYVGEIANFVIGCAFVVPASLIYRYHKTFRFAVVSMVVGTLTLAVIGGFLNYYVLIPAYMNFYHMELDEIISAGSAVNPFVGNLKTLIAFAVVPFNLIKGILCSAINFLLYKRLSRILHL